VNRQDALETLRKNPDIPVLIIGGGINGIGTFHDLALQGVDAVLVERDDFCSGASAASSHMAHGGIRYLENGEFRLVKEALRERNRLLRNAPHYVKPLPTTIPIFKWFSGIFNAPFKFLGWLDKPSERGVLVIKIGMMLYDWYVRDFRIMPTHKLLNRAESLKQYPKLNPEVRYTATYYDGLVTTPERLALEMALDAESLNPDARALNYISVIGRDGKSIRLRDELTGETIEVRPQVVVNAAGPWIDFANKAMGEKTHFIGGTKGSHLVLAHEELRKTISDHEFFFENQDGRIVLILPYFDRVIVGTSDIPVDNPDEAQITEEEIEYFLGMIHRVFPRIQVDRSHIVFGFTGVRPLPAAKAVTTGQISRDHHIEVIEPDQNGPFPILNLVGGKWTTFRAFSEEAADEVLKQLDIPRKHDTTDLPIGGGKEFPESEIDVKQWLTNICAATGVSEERLAILLNRYGTRAADMAGYIGVADDDPLLYAPGYSRREIEFLAKSEKVRHLADLLLRRTLLGMLGRLTYVLIEETAAITGNALGWSEAQQHEEIKMVVSALEQNYLAPTLVVSG